MSVRSLVTTLRDQVEAKLTFVKNVVYGNEGARAYALAVYTGEGLPRDVPPESQGGANDALSS